MEEYILTSRLIYYGALMIILGIVTAIVTYKYVFPIGSIVLIGSGLFLIYWKLRKI